MIHLPQNRITDFQKQALDRVKRVKENPILKEFREFAMRGNMIDLAIGIMIGGGFNKIVSSLVNDIIMPPLGVLIGRMDFSNLYIPLSRETVRSVAQAKADGIPTLNYGMFLNNVLDFAIIALVTFLIVKHINRWKRKEDVPPPAGLRGCPFCTMDISEKATRCPHCTSEVEVKAA